MGIVYALSRGFVALRGSYISDEDGVEVSADFRRLWHCAVYNNVREISNYERHIKSAYVSDTLPYMSFFIISCVTHALKS